MRPVFSSLDLSTACSFGTIDGGPDGPPWPSRSLRCGYTSAQSRDRSSPLRPVTERVGHRDRSGRWRRWPGGSADTLAPGDWCSKRLRGLVDSRSIATGGERLIPVGEAFDTELDTKRYVEGDGPSGGHRLEVPSAGLGLPRGE